MLTLYVPVKSISNRIVKILHWLAFAFLLLTLISTSFAATGKLVKVSDSTVYWLQNGKYYGITNPSYITTQKNASVPNWSGTPSLTTVPCHPNCRPLFVSLNDNASEGLLLTQYQGTDAVYIIENRKKRVLSLQEFNQRSLSFDNVIEVAQGILDLFQTVTPPDTTKPTGRTCAETT